MASSGTPTFHGTTRSKKPLARRLDVGVIGIGRIGRQHALNALNNVPRTNLICVCSPMQQDLDWAAEHLEPYGVNVYKTYEEVLAEPCLEAVIICSPTKFHHDHVIECINRGLHVMVEKPLAMTAAEAKDLTAIASHPANSHIKVMTAFSRRFDDSNIKARKSIEEGKIGMPIVVRSENRDIYDDSDFYYRYIMATPGIFIDTAVHDVDLTLSFFGADAKPKACWATGTIALHKNLAEINDVDNAVGVVEWYPRAPGEPSRVSYYYISRITKHGFDNPIEIMGTEGTLKINLHPRRDLLQEAGSRGIVNDVMPDFYERYEKAFRTELRVFADAVLDKGELPFGLETSQKVMEITEALQKSLRSGKKIEWNEGGEITEGPGAINGSKL